MGKSIQRERDPYFVWRGSLTAEAMRRMAMAGELPGCPPVGYRNGRDGNRKTVETDLISAALVRELFELAASTDFPVRKLLAVMRERGLRSRAGNPIGVSGLYGVLRNPFYCGKVEYGGETFNGKHEPLISKALFDEVRAKLASRRRCLRRTALWLPD
jgi:site-specific DNA recombinase